MKILEMRVHMDCPGCENKIKKSLQKLDGVDNVDIDMFMQKVTVTGWADQKKVLKTVRKTGRQAELWPFPYNPEYHDFNYTYYNRYYRNPATIYAVEPPHLVPAEPYTSYNHSEHVYHGHDDRYSSYNYHEHGYNGHDHGYYRDLPHSTILDDRTRAMFSDDNAHGCSVM